MSGFSAGIATFSSCDKAGSIPYFTAYLQNHPNDYRTLNWRGNAYAILGQQANAIADFTKARNTSEEPRRSLADAKLEGCYKNYTRQKEIVLSTTQRFPKCGEAWYYLGALYKGSHNYKDAVQSLNRSINLGKMYNETGEPWYPWANTYMGDIQRMCGNNDSALEYFKSAVNSCPTMTVAHFGMCQCYLNNNDLTRARESFNTARKLNPKLIHWPTFEKCKEERDEKAMSTSLQHLSGWEVRILMLEGVQEEEKQEEEAVVMMETVVMTASLLKLLCYILLK